MPFPVSEGLPHSVAHDPTPNLQSQWYTTLQSLLLPPFYKGPLMTLSQPDNPGSTPVSRSLHGHLSGRHVILSTTLHNPMAAKPSSPPQHPTSLHLQRSKDKAKTNQFNYNMLYEAGAPPTLARDLQAMPEPSPASDAQGHSEGRAQVRVRKGNKTGPAGPARASAHWCLLCSWQAHSASARARRASCAVTPARSAALSSFTYVSVRMRWRLSQSGSSSDSSCTCFSISPGLMATW